MNTLLPLPIQGATGSGIDHDESPASLTALAEALELYVAALGLAGLHAGHERESQLARAARVLRALAGSMLQESAGAGQPSQDGAALPSVPGELVLVRRPVPVRALQWRGDNLAAVLAWIHAAAPIGPSDPAREAEQRALVARIGLHLPTADGSVALAVGDYIVRDGSGDLTRWSAAALAAQFMAAEVAPGARLDAAAAPRER